MSLENTSHPVRVLLWFSCEIIKYVFIIIKMSMIRTMIMMMFLFLL